MKKLKCYFDGAITINPGGTASYGFVIFSGDEIIKKATVEIGNGDGMSNNVAEWWGLQGLLMAIESLRLDDYEIDIFGDSQLVINGMAGKWRVKAGHLKGIFKMCRKILKRISKHNMIRIQWIKRDYNFADEQSRSCSINCYAHG